MQMTIELPQILDVSDHPRIAVVEQLAETEGCFHAGLGIAIPARRRAEIDVPQRKYIQLPGRDAIGGGEVERRIRFRRGVHPGARLERKIRRRDDPRAQQSGALRTQRQRAEKAMRHLHRRHAAQTVEAPPEPFHHFRGAGWGFEPESGFYKIIPEHCRCLISRLRSAGSATGYSIGRAC